MAEEKLKLDDFVMFDLKTEKLKDKHTFFYLTHNGTTGALPIRF